LPDAVFQPDYGFLWWIPFHLSVIGLGLWLLTAHFSWWAAPLISILIGHAFACLGFIGHAIGHGQSLKKQVWLREFLTGLSFSPFAIGPYLWRRWHNAEHHGHTQVAGVDPDHLFTLEAYENSGILRGLYRRLRPWSRNLVIFSSFSFRMSQQTMRMMTTYLKSPKSTVRDRLTILVQFLIPVVFWAGGTLWLGTRVFWFGYFMPLLVGNAIVISYIATNHFLNPLADESDVLETSLSVTLPKAIRWLDPLHSYFGAHVSHHLFPQAPPKHARLIEAKLAELYPDRYHCMSWPAALRKLAATPWVYEDRTTLIDPQTEQRSGTLGHGLES
jgi:fatty acid desaturase